MSFLDQLFSFLKPSAAARPAQQKEEADCKPSRVPASTEARAWLRDNENQYPFAGEAFSKSEIARHVEDLYQAGASRVTISGIYKEPRRIARDCGPYAATLLVTPKKGKKAALMAILKSRGPDELDFRNGKIRAWWD